ncbi:MarC family protein [Stappia sp. ES.058]|uniref:MarC family protein n=1 Tax=Stappia sp. ES.058 TaxID=1881061 RepID=UPI00087CB56D|nr:MarC family protein [Stappia sp. ES.058]SDT89077.1 multiple antibiotic resistance protein [Stappia sp. ES.058]
MDTACFPKVFAALFAIMKPIANLPVFLSPTAEREPGETRKVALTVIAGLVVGATVILLTGDRLLEIFGIGLNDFRLAGGLLILLIALSMLHGGENASHAGTAREKDRHQTRDNPGIYPPTVPILLGPGTISTIIVFKQQAAGEAQDTALVAAVAGIVTLVGLTFLAEPLLGRLLGQTAISIVSRLMGMILAAIAMEMMVTSLRALWPGLAG